MELIHCPACGDPVEAAPRVLSIEKYDQILKVMWRLGEYRHTCPDPTKDATPEPEVKKQPWER